MRKDKNKALKLRLTGKSYSEISKELKIPKSTLSFWLKNVIIDSVSRKKLQARAYEAGLKALLLRNKQQTIEAKQRARSISVLASEEIKNLASNELKLIGCALYLGEGGKTGNRVDFTNSNGNIIKIMVKFFREVCKVKTEKFRVQLALHEEKNIKSAQKYWSDITGIPINQFIKTSLSISKRSKKRRGNLLPFGTIQVRIFDVKLFHTIQGWIQGIFREFDNVPG